MRKTAQQPSQSSSAYTFIISVCSHPRALITDETMPKLTIQERNFVVHTRGDGHVYGTIVAKLEGRWTKVSKTTVGKLCWRFEATGLVAYRVHETADSFGIAHQENTEFAWVCEGHSQSFAGPRNRYFLCDLRSLGKSCEVAFYANIIIMCNFAIICEYYWDNMRINGHPCATATVYLFLINLYAGSSYCFSGRLFQKFKTPNQKLF